MLLLFLVVFFIVVFVYPTWKVWHQTGRLPFAFRNRDNAHDFNGKIFAIISVLEFFVVAMTTFSSSWTGKCVPIEVLDKPFFHHAGWGLALGGFLVIVIAQAQMANAWRIGIDENHPAALITHGIFKYSRNPVFLGILIINLGVFFILPNAITLLILALTYTSLQTQVRIEEAFLLHLHGKKYRDYMAAVRRWI